MLTSGCDVGVEEGMPDMPEDEGRRDDQAAPDPAETRTDQSAPGETAEHPGPAETAEHPGLAETAEHQVAGPGETAEQPVAADPVPGTDAAAARWSARARVPPPDLDSEPGPTTEWQEGGQPPRSPALVALIALAVFILLALIGLGLWLLLRDRGTGPVTPPTSSPSAATSTAPTTGRPTRSPTTPAATTGPALLTIPDLRGQDADRAIGQLGVLGVVAEKREQPDAEIDAGKVIGTNPGAGTGVPPGSKVIVLVSTGVPAPPTGEPTTPGPAES